VEWLARLHLDHLGMAVDALAGDRYAEGKAAAIAEFAVTTYVGDHVADMAAARAAGVPGVGVPTGPCSAADLTAAGATVVLDTLAGLPAWLDRG
jgi:phosphoglycolate phosphatase